MNVATEKLVRLITVSFTDVRFLSARKLSRSTLVKHSRLLLMSVSFGKSLTFMREKFWASQLCTEEEVLSRAFEALSNGVLLTLANET